MLIASLCTYVLIVLLGFGMTSALHFYILAIMVGLVQGGSQSISRSILSDLMPPNRTGEFFGFVNITSKFSSIFGPFAFGLIGQITGNPRLGILSLLLFFGLGIAVVAKLNLGQGKADALRDESGDSEAGTQSPATA